MRKGALLVTVVGLAGVAAQCVALPHLLKIGTCASGNAPFAIANPCPSGTGEWVLLIGGGMALAIICMVAGAFTSGGLFGGAGLLLWSAEFLGVGLAVLLTVLLGHNLNGGAKSAGYTIGIIFIPMGGIPLLYAIRSWMDGAENKIVARRKQVADATISRVDELQRSGPNQSRVRITYMVSPPDVASFEVSRETNAIVSHMPRRGDRVKISYDPRHLESFDIVSNGVTVLAPTAPQPLVATAVPGLPGASGVGTLPWASSLTAAAAPQRSDPVTRLKQLSDLHERGALTDTEFQNEKAKILAEP